MEQGYDKQVFAKNLIKYMDLTSSKQTDICKLLGVSKSTVSSWCAGQKIPRMDKIERLANYFGVMKSDLIEEKPTLIESELSEKHKELIQIIRASDESEVDRISEIIKLVRGSRD